MDTDDWGSSCWGGMSTFNAGAVVTRRPCIKSSLLVVESDHPPLDFLFRLSVSFARVTRAPAPHNSTRELLCRSSRALGVRSSNIIVCGSPGTLTSAHSQLNRRLDTAFEDF